MRKLVILGLVLVLVSTGCGDTAQSRSLEYYDVLEEGINKLREYETSYVVATVIESPTGMTHYIENIVDDMSYTEYPVDISGNLGTLAYASQESIEYALTDWLLDGQYYVFMGNDDGTDTTYRLPDSYASELKNRNVMYADLILENALDITLYETKEMDLGYGSELITMYRVKIPSETVEHILGINTYGLYKSLHDKNKDNSIGVLCGYYMSDLEMNLTFSDGNVMLGLDKDGVLQYMSLEAGGLGSRLYFTKLVVEDENPYIRQTPDFSVAINYEVMLQDLADFVATYSSYDDAVKALEELNALSTDSGVNEGSISDDSPVTSEVVDSNYVVEGGTEK